MARWRSRRRWPGFTRTLRVLAFPSLGAHRIAGMKQKALYETGFVDVPAGQSLPAEMVIDREPGD